MSIKLFTMLLLIGALATGFSLEPSVSKYIIIQRMIINGKGIVDEEVFSRAFRLIPNIQGWQRLENATLLVNSKPASFMVKLDDDGNLFVYPGDLDFNGNLNITLMQVVDVVRPPFRRVAMMPEEIAQLSSFREELFKSPFWGCKYRDKNFSNILTLANNIQSQSVNTRDYVVKTAEWVYSNIKYKVSSSGGVQCPAETLYKGEGACADIHTLLTLLLRIQGIDSYLAYAYVFTPGKSLTQSLDKWSYLLVNVEPHVFSVVNSSGYLFPIDVTANTGLNHKDIAENSAVNQLDTVIVVGWIRNTTPDNFLAIFAPNGASKVMYSVEVRRVSELYGDFIVLMLALAISAMLVIRKEEST